MFHKKLAAVKEADMTPSPWVYRQLKRFRAADRGGHLLPETHASVSACAAGAAGRASRQGRRTRPCSPGNLMRLVRPPPQPAWTRSPSHRRVPPSSRPASGRARCLEIDALRAYPTHGRRSARRDANPCKIHFFRQLEAGFPSDWRGAAASWTQCLCSNTRRLLDRNLARAISRGARGCAR